MRPLCGQTSWGFGQREQVPEWDFVRPGVPGRCSLQSSMLVVRHRGSVGVYNRGFVDLVSFLVVIHER